MKKGRFSRKKKHGGPRKGHGGPKKKAGRAARLNLFS